MSVKKLCLKADALVKISTNHHTLCSAHNRNLWSTVLSPLTEFGKPSVPIDSESLLQAMLLESCVHKRKAVKYGLCAGLILLGVWFLIGPTVSTRFAALCLFISAVIGLLWWPRIHKGRFTHFEFDCAVSWQSIRPLILKSSEYKEFVAGGLKDAEPVMRYLSKMFDIVTSRPHLPDRKSKTVREFLNGF